MLGDSEVDRKLDLRMRSESGTTSATRRASAPVLFLAVFFFFAAIEIGSQVWGRRTWEDGISAAQTIKSAGCSGGIEQGGGNDRR